jgi:hypothetical protein
MPLSTVRNELMVFERTLRRVLAFKKVNILNQIKFRRPMSGRLKKSARPPEFRK